MIQDKHIQDFTNWCQREHIRVTPNTEIFFINERKTLVPMFQLGNNLFVHIVDSIEKEELGMYQSFAYSFHTIIVIPKDVIEDLIKHISKQDIAQHFKIKL
jgi:hypothetical protein